MAPRVLIFTQYFAPAFRGGGPIRSISNLLDWLGDEFEFRVVTGDRDYGMDRPFSSVEVGSWTEYKGSYVYYVPRQCHDIAIFIRMMRDQDPEVIFINSCFEPYFGIQPLLVSWLLGQLCRTVIAPRGELSEGAMNKGRWKKRGYISIISGLGLPSRVIWKASNEREVRQIRRWMGEEVDCEVASNLPELMDGKDNEERATIGKSPGELRLAYLSRVNRKKNLKFAIDCVGEVRGRIHFDVFGPRDDPSYWSKCQSAATDLPDRVTFRYRGVVDHSEVIETLSNYHAFILPTRDENYGHVIMEGLRAGCIMLISDQTPWTELEDRGAGWVLPLEAPARWVEALDYCVDMTDDEFCRRREVSVELAKAEAQEAATAADRTRALLKKAAARG